MSLVFVGNYTSFHHQCFKMVDVLIHHYEQTKSRLNPYATPCSYKEQIMISDNDVKVEKKKTDTSEDMKEAQAHNDSTDSNNQWTNEGRIFQRNIRKQQTSEDLSVKTNNDDRHEVLKDTERQCYPTENKFNETKHCKTKPTRMKSNKHYVCNVENSLLNKTIEIFSEKDNNNNEDELNDEIERINQLNMQVTSKLSCQVHDDWMDMKKKLNIEVISKEGDELTWCKTNGQWHGTILQVKEIIQLYFNDPKKAKLRVDNEHTHNCSTDDDDISHRSGSVSSDSMGVECDDAHASDSAGS